jgi:hypothetical protein
MALSDIPDVNPSNAGLTPTGIVGLLKSVRDALVAQLVANPTTTPVRAASTGNIASLAAASTTFDGITLVEGDLVLLKDQSTGSQNGVYEVGVVNSGSAPLTRADGFTTAAGYKAGTALYIQEGTVNARTSWTLITTGAITLGSTTLTFLETGRPRTRGTATLVSGTVTVSTQRLRASSKIFLSLNTPGGTQGTHYAAPAASRTAGDGNGSFVINAVNTSGATVTTDTSTIDWEIAY